MEEAKLAIDLIKDPLTAIILAIAGLIFWAIQYFFGADNLIAGCLAALVISVPRLIHRWNKGRKKESDASDEATRKAWAEVDRSREIRTLTSESRQLREAIEMQRAANQPSPLLSAMQRRLATKQVHISKAPPPIKPVR